MSRIPWQVSAAMGWTGLLIAPQFAEVIERESPSAVAAPDKTRTNALHADAVAKLKRDGFVIVDDLLNDEVLKAAHANCADLVEDGAFADTDQHDATVRSDQVFWVSDDARAARKYSGLKSVLHELRSLAHTIDSTSGGWRGFDGAPSRAELGVPSAGQLARYAVASRMVVGERDDASELASANVVSVTGGARYTAHRDGFPLSTASLLMMIINPGVCMRELTAIVYLTSPNPWPDEAASFRVVQDKAELRPGALVLYSRAAQDDNTGESAAEIIEILPVGGRAVIFDSRTVLHEVMPNTSPQIERLAMTVWIGGPHGLAGLIRHLHSWMWPDEAG